VFMNALKQIETATGMDWRAIGGMVSPEGLPVYCSS